MEEISTPEHIKINSPQSSWYCEVIDITYRPGKGKAPNWFWRKTQHLILGIKWTKEPKK